jgi:5'-nucleotidase
MINLERKNAQVLLLDAGDTLYSDQYLTQQSKGALIIEAMNMMDYDAMVIGERDLLLGVDVLRQRIAEADFPIISANLYENGSDDLFVEPYTIVEKNYLKIGVLGLTGTSTDESTGFMVVDPVRTTQDWVFRLKNEVDVVVVLSHLGWTENNQLAQLPFPIDFIVGGGYENSSEQFYISESNTRLAQAEYPVIGHAGRVVGRWEITAVAGYGVISSNWGVVSLDAAFNADQSMVMLLERYINP